jgi:hypothetical protein
MVGGAFSDFMGQEKYSIVRLIQGTVSSEGQDRFDRVLRVFPNPASGSIRVTVQPSPEASADRHFGKSVVNIIDLSGRVVANYPWTNKGQYDISGLAKGVYLVELRGDEGVLGVEKVVKE